MKDYATAALLSAALIIGGGMALSSCSQLQTAKTVVRGIERQALVDWCEMGPLAQEAHKESLAQDGVFVSADCDSVLAWKPAQRED